MIFGVGLCDNGFMHHGRDFNSGSLQMYFTVLFLLGHWEYLIVLVKSLRDEPARPYGSCRVSMLDHTCVQSHRWCNSYV